jgi:hypothetical protein
MKWWIFPWKKNHETSRTFTNIIMIFNDFFPHGMNPVKYPSNVHENCHEKYHEISWTISLNFMKLFFNSWWIFYAFWWKFSWNFINFHDISRTFWFDEKLFMKFHEIGMFMKFHETCHEISSTSVSWNVHEISSLYEKSWKSVSARQDRVGSRRQLLYSQPVK